MPTEGVAPRSESFFRRVTWTRVLVFIALVAVTLLVGRSCQESSVPISDDQALAIAERQIDFRPQGHTIRVLRGGFPSRPFWVVSFWIQDREGGPRKLTVVWLDARTGKVTKVERRS